MQTDRSAIAEGARTLSEAGWLSRTPPAFRDAVLALVALGYRTITLIDPEALGRIADGL